MKNTIILAAGRSSRFGRNKLEERFSGKTLPRLAAEFAVANGAERVYLTLSRNCVKTDGSRVYHPVLEDVRAAGIEPIVAFQPDDTYGPGAAISLWAPVIDGPVTCLFGDNYYHGSLTKDQRDLLSGDFLGVVFTSQSRQTHPRNLQLAAVSKTSDYILEKPHSILEGNFFCGFVRFPAGYLQKTGTLKKSERGEVEVADMINFSERRLRWDLGYLGLAWGDITYESDVPGMREMVAAYEGK